MPTIHKTTLTLTILSPEPIPLDMPLEDLSYEIDEGSWIGEIAITAHRILPTQAAVRSELLSIRNDGSFFDLLFELDSPEDS